MMRRERRVAEIKEAHLRYARQHLKNSSTRGVLAAAFTDEVADSYMRNVMFDGLDDEEDNEEDDEVVEEVIDDDDDDDDIDLEEVESKKIRAATGEVKV